MGVVAYVLRAFMTPEMMESTLSAEEITLIEETPAWATAAYAVAVWAGALGSLLLLMRKSSAHFILMLSLLGIVVQMTYNFFLSTAYQVYGAGGSILPIFILLVGILLVMFARNAKKKGWIR